MTAHTVYAFLLIAIVTKSIHEKGEALNEKNHLPVIAFLLVAFSVAAVVLIGYIRLNADITTLNEEIAKQEKVLNSMRMENAESLSRIESSIDIEEIKRVAIQELGMTYPKEGQIISYDGVTYDYVRKVDESN